MKNVMDNKEFWKTMRSFSSDKNSIFLQISIEKNKLVISDESDFSEELSPLLKMLVGQSMFSQILII